MKPTGYRVVFQRIQQGKDIRVVKQGLADAFHSTPEKMGILLSKLPVVLKENVDHASAMKYQKAVLKAGGDCRVEPIGATGGDASDSASVPSGSASPLKICPKCGYQATSLDDPLLTAHEGKGECPACGIILARFDRGDAKQQPAGTAPAAGEDPGRSSISVDNIRRAISFHPKMLFIGLILIAAIVYYSMSGNEPPANHQAVRQVQPGENQAAGQAADLVRKNAESIQAMEKHAEKIGPSFKMLPGERKVFTISCYLPFLHEDKFDPVELEPVWRVDTNSWKEMGVEAEVIGATVETDSVPLWELKQEPSEIWRPVRAYHGMTFDGTMRIIWTERSEALENVKWRSCNNVFALKRLAEMPPEGVDKAVKRYEGGSPELRQSRYFLYRATLKVSIRLPAGDEFGARELKKIGEGGKEITLSARTGKVLVKVIGAKTKDAAATIELSFWAHLELVQEAGKDGIIVRLPSNSIMPDWEIRDESLG